jgi:uncharacterized phage-associated protein
MYLSEYMFHFSHFIAIIYIDSQEEGMFYPGFQEQKVTEAACYLLSLNDGRIDPMKLLKLLYLADRMALKEWERPISYDTYVSMDYGPVLSSTYDLIKGSSSQRGDFWRAYIATLNNQTLVLKGKPPKIKKLSKAEIEVLERIFECYKRYDSISLSRICHKLPEYRDPRGSSIPISLSEILAALEYDQSDIERIDSELKEEASIQAVFGD